MTLEFVTQKDLRPQLEQEIVTFLDSQSSAHPFQFPRWTQSLFAVLRKGGAICWFASCGTQLPLGTRFAWFRALHINRGPVCDDQELSRMALDELVRYTRENRFVYLDVAPDRLCSTSSDPGYGFGPDWKSLGEGRISMRLDLTDPPDELLRRFRSTTRYKIRKAERAGVIVEPAQTAADVDQFLEVYTLMTGRKRYLADSPEHLRRLIHWLIAEPTRGALLLARYRNSVAGGAVIVRSGKRCWYVWGANDRSENFSAGHIVQWQAILWAGKHGCSEYDFGGYTPGATAGPAWFKEGFAGQVVHFVPARRYVLRRPPYQLFRILSRARQMTVALTC